MRRVVFLSVALAMGCGARTALEVGAAIEGGLGSNSDGGTDDDVASMPDVVGDVGAPWSGLPDATEVSASEAEATEEFPEDAGAADAPVESTTVSIDASGGTFCAPSGRLDALDVWSDDRGVFVLTAQYLANEIVQQFSGSAWKDVYRASASSMLMRLTGFADGPLVLYGEASCGIRFVTGGAATCSAAVSYAASVHTVASDLAYAVQNDRVLWYRGSDWTQLGAPLTPAGQVDGRSIWSDGDASLVAASQGEVFLAPASGVFVPQTGLPQNAFLSSWGSASGDLWVGDSVGNLFHGDGTTWKRVWADAACGRPIRGIWGTTTTVCIRTTSSVGCWDGAQMQSIVDFGCNAQEQVTGLWGNSATNIFFTLRDPAREGAPCGSASVIAYDGISARGL